MSKTIREKLWLVLGCFTFTVGIYLTFGIGPTLIVGGAAYIVGYIFEGVWGK